MVGGVLNGGGAGVADERREVGPQRLDGAPPALYRKARPQLPRHGRLRGGLAPGQLHLRRRAHRPGAQRHRVLPPWAHIVHRLHPRLRPRLLRRTHRQLLCHSRRLQEPQDEERHQLLHRQPGRGGYARPGVLPPGDPRQHDIRP